MKKLISCPDLQPSHHMLTFTKFRIVLICKSFEILGGIHYKQDENYLSLKRKISHCSYVKP